MDNSKSRLTYGENGDDPVPKESHSLLKRIAWSVTGVVVGAGLGCVIPEVTAVMLTLLGLFENSSSQDWSGLAIIELILVACVLAALVGGIAGAVRPGMNSVLLTLACLLATDIVSLLACLFLLDVGQRFLLMFFVSATVKILVICGLFRFRMDQQTL